MLSELVLIVYYLGLFIALATFWIPLLAKKGGVVHIAAGRIFACAVALLSLSGMFLAVYQFQYVGTPIARGQALMQFFLALMLGATTWYGVRVQRLKHRRESRRPALDILIAAVFLLASAALAAFGLYHGRMFLGIFPMVGVLLAAGQLYYWLRRRTSKKQWWFEHMAGMFGAILALVTLFLMRGVEELLSIPPIPPLFLLIPTYIIAPTLIIWMRYYDRKFAREGSS